jgi:hypothetical protein
MRKRDLSPNATLPKWINGSVMIMSFGFVVLLSSTFLSEVRAQQKSSPASTTQKRVAPPAPSAFKPVATVQQVMTVITIPTSDVIFGAGGDAPKTDSAWQTVQNNALALAESGNLLMIPGRARDNQEWVQQSQTLIDAAMSAFSAAGARNADKLAEAGGQDLQHLRELSQQIHG